MENILKTKHHVTTNDAWLSLPPGNQIFGSGGTQIWGFGGGRKAFGVRTLFVELVTGMDEIC